ncbi:MAG: hypothetical protein ACRYGR_06565 [Janthinobacterium lividum]
MFKIILSFHLIFLFQISYAENLPLENKQIIDDTHETSIIDQITGVYKYNHRIFYISGESNMTENILEIVKINDNTIYFRTYLEFTNGHTCTLHGTAAYKGNNLFLYEDKANSKCKLEIIVGEKGIGFFDRDKPYCRDNYCGTRGGFDGASFEKFMRKPIKYMKILKNSIEYKSSIEELNK